MNFAEQLRRAEQLAKSGGSLIIPGKINDLNGGVPCESHSLVPHDLFTTLNDDPPRYGIDFPEPIVAIEKPTEEFARNYIAAMMGVPPEKITNVTITPDGMGWNFAANVIVDKPRSHCVMFFQ